MQQPPPPFDPYAQWLEIPRDQRPLNHYTLLGLTLYEGHAALIGAAADRRLAQLRGPAEGPCANTAQRLIGEVEAARLCLLDERTKACYDCALRESLTPSRSFGEEDSSASPQPPGNQPAPPSLPLPSSPAPSPSPALPRTIREAPDVASVIAPDVASVIAPDGRDAVADRPEPPLVDPQTTAPAAAHSAKPMSRWLVIGTSLVAASSLAAALLAGGLLPAGLVSPAHSPGPATGGNSPVPPAPAATPQGPLPLGVLMQEANGNVQLPAALARLEGTSFQRLLDDLDGKIAGWTSLNDRLHWKFRVVEPGMFEVLITYESEAPGGAFELAVNEDAPKECDVRGGQPGAPELVTDEYVVHVPRRDNILHLRPQRIPEGGELMRLKKIVLRPLKSAP